MASLIVDRLRCIEEHDGFGEDDAYLVYFIGRNPSSASSLHVRGPGSAWSDIGSGEVREDDVTLDSAYNPANLYLMALIDRDAGRDIAGSEKANVENWMKILHLAFSANGTASLQSLAAQLQPEMVKALLANFNGDDDNLLGVRWLRPLNANGQWRALNYYGDSHQYRVKFLRQ